MPACSFVMLARTPQRGGEPRPPQMTEACDPAA
jgi:hypothetical protein